MTTPLGVPNLPIGALTVETLGEILQDMSAAAMRQRAGDRFPNIFNLTTGGDVLANLTPFGILSAIWAEFYSRLATADPEDVQGPDDIPDLLLDFIEDLPIIGLLFKFLEALGLNPESVESFLKPIFQFLNTLWETLGATVLNAILAIFDFISSVIDFETIQELLEDVVGYFTGLLSPQRFVELLKSGIKILLDIFNGLNLTGINSLVTEAFSWLINFFRSTLDAGAATFADLFDAAKTFLADIPLVGALLGLAGNDTVNGKPIATLPDLVAWFQSKVLTVDSAIPASNLTGAIPRKLLGSIGVGNIDDTTPNQVDLSTFPSASVMQVGGRWSWDGSVSRASGSGSAKVTCASAAARMFSNKVPVVPGQLLSLSAWVKWSSLSNSTVLSSPISIGVRTYNQGVIQQAFSEVAAVPTIGLAANSNFVEVKNLLAWTVPPNVNEVRMAIGVTQSATAGTVWFDDVALRKTNNLAQNLVDNLPDDLFEIGNTAGTAADNADAAAESAAGAQDAIDGTNQNLFGTLNPSSGAIVRKEVVPMNDIGAALTTAGSGAQFTRRNENNFNITGGRNPVPNGFWDTRDRKSADITTPSSGGYYTGAFQVTIAGWYLVEVGYRLKPSFVAFGYQLVPVLFRNGSVYRMGTDATSAGPGQRYVQSVWIVYLDPTHYVQAGYEGAGITAGLLDADAAGTETYFSIALLNRSYE